MSKCSFVCKPFTELGYFAVSIQPGTYILH